MRALVIGRGSMGKRRIRDLKALGVEVVSWDITDGVDLVDFPWGESFGKDTPVAVICTPPKTKGPYSRAFHRFFTEADVEPFTEEGIYTRYPSCTPRFVPAIRRIKERTDIGRPVAYTLHVGQNLLDWHPGADLSTYYAAQRATGACREMVPFELGWLTWVFGPVTKAKALRANTANLADIDDVYQVVVEHGDGKSNGSGFPVLGHLLIDVVSRPARRTIHVVGTAGTFSQDIVFTEAAYLAEMRAFIESVEGGKPWPYTLAEERATLDVLRMIEQFS